MKTILLAVLFSISFNIVNAQIDTLTIKYSESIPTIDGVLSDGEWDDLDTILINRSSEWQIKVLAKHDKNNVFFAFIDLANDDNLVISELLFDSKLNNDTTWDSNTLWFHGSYSDCFHVGGFYNWNTCSNTKSDWSVNNLPFQNGNDNMEFQISYSKLAAFELGYLNNAFRLCYDVGGDDTVSYWPDKATMSNPSTWGYGKFEGNFSPLIKTEIVDIRTKINEEITIQLDTFFYDDGGIEKLNFTVELNNGSDLPAWLTYNSLTKSISGISTDTGTFNIKVSASDIANESVSDVFKLIVEKDLSVTEKKAIDEVFIYPNPTNDIFRLETNMTESIKSYQIFNTSGEIIKQRDTESNMINIKELSKGLYVLNLLTENGLIIKKIVVE